MRQNPRILRLAEVMNVTGLARSTIYLKAAQGTFPAPIKLGMRASGWLDTEVHGWISECIQARSNRVMMGGTHV